MKRISVFLFAIVALMCISVVFTSCSKDDDDEISISNTNTFTIDGVTKPILSAGIDNSDMAEGNYDIYFFLSEDKKERVNIMASALYHDGKTIDLSQKEAKHDGWYWSIEYRVPDKKRPFNTFGDPGSKYPVFQTGTLYIKRTGFGAEFEIRIKDGKVKAEDGYGDGEEHTISLYFKGMMDLGEF
jgi:hypothetical protein